ncbi:MAG TPA: ABC transporter permease/substrate-binding protein [Pyrinomonadaceae bacterium]|nr:ABC transporter permease/substrate-binding protein [Pyrinomonadaceae bacterium]
MNFWQFLQQNWPELLVHVRDHFYLVLVSILIAIAIGIPAGILLTRKQSLRGPVLGLANIMQTIPSLALFGFLIPLPFIGGIGARTAVVALVLYSLLPIIRNTVTGILGVDANVREAAVAMGMTDTQILRQVELPLAMSVIVTGVRVAMVIAIGVTTIAAAVGAGGLGVYIFRGLRQYDNNLLLAGAGAAALMALGADFILGFFERRFAVTSRSTQTKGRRTVVWLATAALVVFVIAGFFYLNAGNASDAASRVVVGSKDFTESVILAEIMAQMLEQRGVSVERTFELGGNLPHDAVLAGKIDIYPEYTGTAYTAILRYPVNTDPAIVFNQVKKDYDEKFNLVVTEPLGFENTFAILVRGVDARRLKLKTVSDAIPHAANWRAGFGQDFMTRDDGYPGFSKRYSLQFAQRPSEMDLSLTYIALQAGQVDLIAGNSTEGRIAALDLVQLEDDRRYFPPYEAVYIGRRDTIDRVAALREAQSTLAGAITTDEMRQLNYEVDANKRSPAEVVREWLAHKGTK